MMVGPKLNNRLTRRLHEVPPKEFNLAISVAVLIAALNALWVAYRVGYSYGEVGCGYPCTSEHQDYSLLLMQCRIAVALTLIATGLCFRRVIGFIGAVLATAYVGKEYLWWYFDSWQRLKEIGVRDFSQLPAPHEIQHAGNLYGATWWNVLVLVVTAALFVWEMKTLTRLLISYREADPLAGKH
jgi:hypothetical protein